MRRRIDILVLSVLIFMFCLIATQEALSFTIITAEEAYQMLYNEEAKLIDVRTKEEYAFVGSASLEPNGTPIGYLISWKLFDGIDNNGTKRLKDNPDFNALVDILFGNNKNQPLILMCACGLRSTYAAERLESLGYTNIYEIDNILREATNYPGGFGGFEGPSYGDTYNGYKGYPGRLPIGNVETVTANIDSPDDSVSWMDSGLPITFNIDPAKIPSIPHNSSNTSSSQNYFNVLGGLPYSNLSFGFTNLYQPFVNPLYGYQASSVGLYLQRTPAFNLQMQNQIFTPFSSLSNNPLISSNVTFSSFLAQTPPTTCGG